MKTSKIKSELLKLDEVLVLELLDISTEDLLERFEDKIAEREAYLRKEIELDNLPEQIKELNFD